MRPLLLLLILCSPLYADSLLVEVTLPINGNNAQILQKTLERLDLTNVGKDEYVILQFNVPAGEELNAQDNSFGSCYELAELLSGDKFRSVKTAAWFPQTIIGHCLLVAFACKERIIANEAELVPPKPANDTEKHAYLDTARRQNIPPAVIEKIFDIKLPLLQIETPTGTQLTTESPANGNPQTIIPAGQPGIFSANLARQIGIVQLIADDRISVARGLGIEPNSLKIVVARKEISSAVRVHLNGVMTADKSASVIRSIRQHVDKNNTDFLILEIDSPGGNLEASLKLATFLATEIDRKQVKTVSYVPYQARSDAAVVAAACDEVVLGYGSVLGGDGARVFTNDQIADTVKQIQSAIAKETWRSWSVPASFVDPNLEIRKMRLNRVPQAAVTAEYLCQEEFDTLANKQDWQTGDTVKVKGLLLEIKVNHDGVPMPTNFGIVDRTARDFNEFKTLFHLENEPALAQPVWTDKVILVLSSPEMSIIYLLLAWMGITIEAKTPGVGIGAFVAVVAVVLFFWTSILSGTAGYLEILLFLTGIGCLLFELFVLPGFGIFGIGGVAAILASFVLASQTFVIPQNSYQFAQLQHTLLILVAGGCGLFGLGYYLTKSLDKYTKITDAEQIQQTEKLADYDYLTGERGMTVTPLVPAGKIVIGDREYDVVSDGMLIDEGEPVEVVSVVGYKITVRAVTDIKC
ncbi:nodulation protein NfeD [Planctomycetales bacterium]|nr:nodulation protein NfeD [Planctomycetales bacterium]